MSGKASIQASKLLFPPSFKLSCHPCASTYCNLAEVIEQDLAPQESGKQDIAKKRILVEDQHLHS